MKNVIVLALLVVFMMPFAASQVFAEETQGTAQTGIVDVGNKICPVMGGPVNGQNFVVYEGKRYGLCCSGCEKTFLKDPALYSVKASGSVETIASPVSESEEMEKDMEQGSL
jgi:YHS domain-containing protein